MNKIKFKDFIKKMLLLLLVLLIINGPLIVFARPGGGGSSGGGGGGGGSSSGGSSSSYYDNSSYHSSSSRYRGASRYNRRNSNPIEFILTIGVFAIIGSAGAIILKIRLSKKKVESVIAIKRLSRKDFNWDYKEMKKDIKESFYKVGIAWMERDQGLAKDYVSEKLYKKHKMQTGWMIVRNEKNILKRMKLLGATPIALRDNEGTSEDFIWVHIKAKSIDYTINEETNEVIEGNRFKSVYYEEYWKFVRSKDRWILDEIKQIEDINNLDFFGVEVNSNNN